MSNTDDDYKNALPGEVRDRPDSGMPRQLRTQAENERPLEAREAAVAGVSPDALGEYGDDSENPNAGDRRDVASTDEPDR